MSLRNVATRGLRAGLAALVCFAAVGCVNPLRDSNSDTLRESIRESAQRETASSATQPEKRPLARTPSRLDFPPGRLEELEEMAGPPSYEGVPLVLGANLLGRDTELVALNLRDAMTRAVNNNLTVQFARLEPAISEAQIVAADAAFDWTLFASTSISRTDQPNRVPVVNGVPVGSSVNESQAFGFETGIRKALTTGGSLEIATTFDINNNRATGIELFPDPSRSASLDITLGQPLLRGFGSDVALAQVRLAENLERDSIQQVRSTLLDTVTEAEVAYWNLYFSWAELLIRQRLLQRGIETRDVLAGRLEFDVKPAEFSDAVARVEARRADLIRASNRVRQASDALKLIINDPELTVGGEAVLTPLDAPIDEAIEVSLFDSISTALQKRPEIARALIAIDDASIRQLVAENARLPLLDLTFQASFSGLDENADDAYGDIAEGRFVDLLLALQFEQPIGNRGPRAEARRARLIRLQSAVAYRSAVQSAVLDVKTSLRDIRTNYQLIEQTRISRLAAAENLRTLLVEEESIRALTPEFLDLKLTRQEALAIAELEEIRARADYMTAIAELQAATGDALERNNVRLIVPDPGEETGGLAGAEPAP